MGHGVIMHSGNAALKWDEAQERRSAEKYILSCATRRLLNSCQHARPCLEPPPWKEAGRANRVNRGWMVWAGWDAKCGSCCQICLGSSRWACHPCQRESQTQGQGWPRANIWRLQCSLCGSLYCLCLSEPHQHHAAHHPCLCSWISASTHPSPQFPLRFSFWYQR